ncbi:MAG: biotin--[acetyl-CoA-carboxylase] ligase [Hyphomicrobiaceae bacterium]|nr:biotin--[acetyl-CoA-carboxylase] ligase [Hyphomicrobiaceae bacterium]
MKRIDLLSCASTNTEAMARALAGELGPVWITAREQTAGRGRSGRTWAGGAGNLAASLLVTLHCPAASLGQLALVAGLAVHGAVASLAEATVHDILRVKWPNDLMIGTDKCGGILIETTRSAGGGHAVVIGFGLNLAMVPEGLDRPATALARHGFDAHADAVLERLDRHLALRLREWRSGAGFASIRADWLVAAGSLGQAVAVRVNGARLEGRFAGIDQDGCCLVTDGAGVTHAITFGDVEMI